MNLGELRTYCNYMVNKDQKGNPATPPEFQVLANVAQNKFFDQEYQNMLRLSNEKGTPLSELLINNNKMKRYISEMQLINNGGRYPLSYPEKFKHELSATCQNGSRPAEKRRYVELLSAIQFDRETTNDLRDDLDEVVYGKYRPEAKDFKLSSTWDYIYLSYIRAIVSVVFDYCYDQQGNIYYMPPQYVIKYVGGNYNLYDTNDNLIVANITHPTATVYPYTSLSVELDVDSEFHKDIASSIIMDMSVKDRELDVTQMQMQKQ